MFKYYYGVFDHPPTAADERAYANGTKIRARDPVTLWIIIWSGYDDEVSGRSEFVLD